MKATSPIAILEVMGRDAGWLPASAALAKRNESDAPHLIYPPEFPVYEEKFLESIENAYRKYGYAFAVIAENVQGPGGPLGGQGEPLFVDDFGHPYYDGPGRYLSAITRKHMNLRARYMTAGTIQRSFAECVSRTDVQEAEMCGRDAVRYALDGQTDKLVTLVREPGSKYKCSTGLAPLEDVGGKVKAMPAGYLDAENNFVTQEFIEYVRPLVGGSLPQFGRVR
jgi:6-phosphofructokinase 1